MKHTKEEVIRKMNYFRRQYKAGKMSAEHVAKLESIPGWTWEVDLKTPTTGGDIVPTRIDHHEECKNA